MRVEMPELPQSQAGVCQLSHTDGREETEGREKLWRETDQPSPSSPVTKNTAVSLRV